jgi:hypothetical protein
LRVFLIARDLSPAIAGMAKARLPMAADSMAAAPEPLGRTGAVLTLTLPC